MAVNDSVPSTPNANLPPFGGGSRLPLANLVRDAYRMLPGLEALVLFVRVPPGNAFAPTGGYLLRHGRRKSFDKADLAPALQKVDAVFEVWTADLTATGAPLVKVRDVFADAAGARYGVEHVKRRLGGACYDCYCCKEPGSPTAAA